MDSRFLLSPTAVRVLGALSNGDELNYLDIDEHLQHEYQQPEILPTALVTALARDRAESDDHTESFSRRVLGKLARLEKNGYIEANIRTARSRKGKLRDMKFYRITERGRLALSAYIEIARSKSASLLNGSTRYFEMLTS